MSEAGRRPARPRLFLVDGSALAYRSHFALGPTNLATTRGEPTGALFGFAATLWQLVRGERPEYIAVFFDAGGPTFRHEQYVEYKAHREAMPDELVRQLPLIDEFVDRWPLPRVAVPGVEADDVIGSYAVQLAGEDLETVIVSGDKDFCQLVGGNVRILNPGRGGPARVEAHYLDVAGVVQKFGVPPERVIDVLALMGDSSDNVPGVPGIGPKTAAALINEFGDLEALLAGLERVSRASVREKLAAHAGEARLSRRLVTIETGLSLPRPLEDLRTAPPGPGLLEFLRRMELNRLLREMEMETRRGGAGALRTAPAAPDAGVAPPRAITVPAGPPAQVDLFAGPAGPDEPAPVAPALPAAGDWPFLPPPADAVYVTVADSALAGLAERLAAPGGFALHTESTGTDPMRAGLVGLAFSAGEKAAFYLPLAHESGPNLPLERVRTMLGPVLADPAVPKSGHDLKQDLLVLERHGLPVAGPLFDTLVAAYLVDSDRPLDLDDLAHDHLGMTTIRRAEVIGRGARARPFTGVPVPLATRASAEKADVALRLRRRLEGRLVEMDLAGLFRDVEMPLLRVLKEMEAAGVALDLPFLARMSGALGAEMARLEEAAHAAAGAPFNLNSPPQLAKILFETLRLPRVRRTRTGFSTDSDVLEELRPLHELPGILLEYRQIMKLKTTYVDALPRLVHPETGRIHTSFNQTVAATGRLSSSDPNLQNIPIRTPLGREVRRAFVAGGGGLVLISADYSQIELRLMAHLSGDERLLDSFRRGVDVHRETAALLFGIEPAAVTPKQRSEAKTVNFGIMYGQGAPGLARQTGYTRAEAVDFIAAYRARFPGVSRFLTGTIEAARRQGYVSTVLGRRRYLPNLRSGSGRLRAEAERMAINTPIQGSAADLIKVAMIAASRDLAAAQPRARLLLTVHDELLLEAPAEEAEAAAALVRARMEGALALDVPVVVDVGIGTNWADIH